MKSIPGIPASHGIKIDPAVVLDRAEIVVETYSIKDPATEWKRFEEARENTRHQLGETYPIMINSGREIKTYFLQF